MIRSSEQHRGRERGPQHERPSHEDRMRELTRMYQQGIDRRSIPVMWTIRDQEGRKLEEDVAVQTGEIDIEGVPKDDDRIWNTRTDSGLITVGRTEMITKEMSGCLTVFVQGATNDRKPLSAMIHLTPRSNLAWGNHREKSQQPHSEDQRQRAAKQIADSLREANLNFDGARVKLISNKGQETSARDIYNGYEERRLKEKRDELAELLKDEGLSAEQIENPPDLKYTTLYFHPDKPDEITAIGTDRKTGKLKVVELNIE